MSYFSLLFMVYIELSCYPAPPDLKKRFIRLLILYGR